MQRLEDGSVMELYVNPDHPLPDHEDRLVRAKDNAKLAEQMGASTLAALDVLLVASATAAEWCRSQGLQPLSAEERVAWVEFLPTGYYSRRDTQGMGYPLPDDTPWRLQRDIRFYQHHEGMPRHVRELFVKVAPLFSMMEIRTTETIDDHLGTGRLIYDPALFGHVIDSQGNRAIYLLARWGESDANFIHSFSDLKQILEARTGFMRPGTWAHRRLYGWPHSSASRIEHQMFSTLTGGVIGAVIAAILQWGGPIALEVLVGGVVAGAALPWLLLVADLLKAFGRKRALASERPDLVHFV